MILILFVLFVDYSPILCNDTTSAYLRYLEQTGVDVLVSFLQRSRRYPVIQMPTTKEQQPLNLTLQATVGSITSTTTTTSTSIRQNIQPYNYEDTDKHGKIIYTNDAVVPNESVSLQQSSSLSSNTIFDGVFTHEDTVNRTAVVIPNHTRYMINYTWLPAYNLYPLYTLKHQVPVEHSPMTHVVHITTNVAQSSQKAHEKEIKYKNWLVDDNTMSEHSPLSQPEITGDFRFNGNIPDDNQPSSPYLDSPPFSDEEKNTTDKYLVHSFERLPYYSLSRTIEKKHGHRRRRHVRSSRNILRDELKRLVGR